MVPIHIIPIDSIRQPDVNDFRNPILSAKNPHERAPAINKKPYVANMVPAPESDIFNVLSNCTKTRGNVNEPVVETNCALIPPVAHIQP
jgi:hypothetical protein